MSADLVKSFLLQFEMAVTNNDPESVLRFFSSEIKAYGTVNEFLGNLEELRENQWGNVWKVATDWKITEIDSIQVNSEHFSVAFRWLRTNQSGQKVPGRCSMFGAIELDSVVVHHTHFSVLNSGHLD